MSEATISLDSHDEELAVFGSRDHLLRLVRDAFRVKVMARHGEIRLEGEPERVEQARQVFEEMRRVYRRQHNLTSSDVASAIDGVTGALPASGETDGESVLEIRELKRVVRARTDGQARYLRALRESELVFAIGPAGTGKTYLAVATAVAALRKGQIRKLILARPAVEAGERLGFLPGDLEAKINPYLRPLFDALQDLMSYDQLRRYMGTDLIEIAPLAYMRGRTLNDAVIILDEAQNATIPQMKMFLTRMGQNARIVVTGDTTQVDLPAGVASGLADAVARLQGVRGVEVITLGRSDIVRHPLVQAIVDAYEMDGSEEISRVDASPISPAMTVAIETSGVVESPDSGGSA
jgi:phosphate starvation-inducible PhoH-like protein